jgi:hypothetical protein
MTVDRVGYRNPPRNARFKKGQSGNPGGRKKGTANFKTIFFRELSGVISVREGERRRSMSRREILIRGLINDALQGDHRARKLVLDTLVLLDRTGTSDHDPMKQVLSDEKIIARLKTRLNRE